MKEDPSLCPRTIVFSTLSTRIASARSILKEIELMFRIGVSHFSPGGVRSRQVLESCSGHVLVVRYPFSVRASMPERKTPIRL